MCNDSRATAALVEFAELPRKNTPSMRAVRVRLSKQLANESPAQLMAIAEFMIEASLRWVAYELINAHPPTMASITAKQVQALGDGINSWGTVDTFGTVIAGPAWLGGRISNAAVERWAQRRDHWWRRAALVATTVLNTRARGGHGDAYRTLRVAELLVADREDMVIKGLSWALRCLVFWDPAAVSEFLIEHESELAARVKREVTNKLETGLKNP
jgi:3-methyladenine DNA glycosylase AlkD